MSFSLVFNMNNSQLSSHGLEGSIGKGGREEREKNKKGKKKKRRWVLVEKKGLELRGDLNI
jgi:hypothetical protein